MRGGRTYVLAAALLGAAALLTIAGVGDRSGFPDWQAFVLGVVQGAGGVQEEHVVAVAVIGEPEVPHPRIGQVEHDWLLRG